MRSEYAQGICVISCAKLYKERRELLWQEKQSQRRMFPQGQSQGIQQSSAVSAGIK